MSRLLRRLHRAHSRLVVREFEGLPPSLPHEIARASLSVLLDLHASLTAEVHRVRIALARR